jgi:hypothetical protein
VAKAAFEIQAMDRSAEMAVLRAELSHLGGVDDLELNASMAR